MYLKNSSLLSIYIILIYYAIPKKLVTTLECSPNEFLYGKNEIVDELLTCSLSRSFDLDLTPQSDRFRATSKTLVEQGLSNKTTIVNAKLSGLWTARRPSFIRSGWKCKPDEILSTSIIELSSLSLELIEKIDIQLHHNQHKLAQHRPCKTFDLPVWMCRQSKPIYRTTTTWINRAYLNLTLSQNQNSTKPTTSSLKPIFTCPETFKQKISHSPSSTYIVARHIQQSTVQPQTPIYHSTSATSVKEIDQVKTKRQTLAPPDRSDGNANHAGSWHEEARSVSHPSSFITLQSGKMPASPPYQNSVKIIMNQVVESLSSSLNDCIHLVDSDLSLVADHSSFLRSKYNLSGNEDERQDLMSKQTEELQTNIKSECSSQVWIKDRIELANEASRLVSEVATTDKEGVINQVLSGHMKRDKSQMLDFPRDHNQLLDPYGYYHQPDNTDQMIDDKY